MSWADDTHDSDQPNQPWTAKCVCGKQFMQPNSYTLHIGSCKGFKGRLSLRLGEAKQRRRGTTTHSTSGPLILGQTTSDAVTPSEGSRNTPWGWKRKLGWINDENLDVDIIVPPPCPGGINPEHPTQSIVVCHRFGLQPSGNLTEIPSIAISRPCQ